MVSTPQSVSLRDRPFLGTGWGFPPKFNKSSQNIVMVKDREDIEESLSILLSTTIGERVMQPRYGCNLKQFLFEPLNASIESYIKKLVEEAILYFEPRIDPLGISLDADDGKLEITVDYIIRSTNTRSNFVYPFYIQEGTNL